jgi:hypothetical protein
MNRYTNPDYLGRRPVRQADGGARRWRLARVLAAIASLALVTSGSPSWPAVRIARRRPPTLVPRSETCWSSRARRRPATRSGSPSTTTGSMFFKVFVGETGLPLNRPRNSPGD